ncbi:UDP-glucose 4-epimerase GalE [Fictibacillus arsenicus]|uniref:UDP-glucose 4-epimerase n=1 Tax=Fictibacillus arsenicus TaxID=255247 RepID=A0A1V3GCL2_9BACL|nr:UDP-glucose 4-epimerase GalE [Fictibacillus arsenicus]OOE14584.1 UDP-glucose 4-epimerase GalE [Fictibacillus arsenicus]
MAILITGGAGYIGSHACVELLNTGYELVVLDNFSNSKPEVLSRIKEITGKNFTFYEVDLLSKEAIDSIFSRHDINAVIHFAGYKAVGESVCEPLKYYHNNITGTLNLCDVMNKHGVHDLVFSSSATVYGIPHQIPITEDFPLGATNPYGRTKQMIEEILRDLYVSDKRWSVALLRYFNPIGAHESGRIGEDPNGIPNNLMPYISQVAAGKLEQLNVFGDDYETVDGTGVRDYIHVVDLAKGHLKALERVLLTTGVDAYNLGSGFGHSVLEMVDAFEQASGQEIPYVIKDRRPGDVGICFADTQKANQNLNWVAEKTLTDMCKDTWKWQSNNPAGYTKTQDHVTSIQLAP